MAVCFFQAVFVAIALAQAVLGGTAYVRLNKSDAALLIVDHQIGLFQLVHDFASEEFKNNVFSHGALAQVFGLPTVITTSVETGPNGPTPHELLDMHPSATIVRRNGEVNAWDNAEFRDAVRATGKTQFIIAGITTETCTTFLSLSMVEEGYTVFANADASGALNQRTADDANSRMRQAGVQVLSMLAIVTELMRDWRSTPGAQEMLPFLDRYLPAYGWIARAHVAAIAAN
ncbi:ycaC protein [Coprinopsis marcescibilis]|nr:ycaC protein [Coprinopsis marcescibilis]